MTKPALLAERACSQPDPAEHAQVMSCHRGVGCDQPWTRLLWRTLQPLQLYLLQLLDVAPQLLQFFYLKLILGSQLGGFLEVHFQHIIGKVFILCDLGGELLASKQLLSHELCSSTCTLPQCVCQVGMVNICIRMSPQLTAGLSVFLNEYRSGASCCDWGTQP